MTLIEASNPLTVDQFIALPDSVGFELIGGVLVERKPMGALSDHVAARFVRHLGNAADATGAGHVFGAETTYRCFSDPRTGRRADASIVAKGRLPGDRIPDGAIEIPADLVVEVVSPTDLAYDLEEKIRLYLDNGFGELWVAFPVTRRVYVHRSDERTVQSLSGNDFLRGRGALAAFAHLVSDFFPAD